MPILSFILINAANDSCSKVLLRVTYELVKVQFNVGRYLNVVFIILNAAKIVD